jgi:hypothetical protein
VTHKRAEQDARDKGDVARDVVEILTNDEKELGAAFQNDIPQDSTLEAHITNLMLVEVAHQQTLLCECRERMEVKFNALERSLNTQRDQNILLNVEKVITTEEGKQDSILMCLTNALTTQKNIVKNDQAQLEEIAAAKTASLKVLLDLTYYRKKKTEYLLRFRKQSV